MIDDTIATATATVKNLVNAHLGIEGHQIVGDTHICSMIMILLPRLRCFESRISCRVDLIKNKPYTFDGEKGENIIEGDVPDDMRDLVEEKRMELIEKSADDKIGELFLMEEEPTEDQLKDAIRRQTIACKFVPVFMGSAFKSKEYSHCLME